MQSATAGTGRWCESLELARAKDKLLISIVLLNKTQLELRFWKSRIQPCKESPVVTGQNCRRVHVAVPRREAAADASAASCAVALAASLPVAAVERSRL